MNEKLIRRAAIKYRNWMMEEANRPNIRVSVVTNQINDAIARSKEMIRWSDRFLFGLKQRIQVNEWEPEIEHKGIVNPNVYKKIATKMIPDLGSDAINSIEYAVNLIKTIIKPNEITPLSMKEAIEEIRIINEAWDTEFRDNTLSITIGNVILSDDNEDVDLGNFIIRLDLTDPIDKLSIASCDEIESGGGYYHPHINDEKLCAGDGKDAMLDALCQGRLEDYFRLVEAVLRTYNSRRPYEELSEWYNPDHEGEFFCEQCEEWRSENDMISCSECNTICCESCSRNIGGCCTGCGKYYCDECINICGSCNEIICHSCTTICAKCEECYCSSCISECETCNSACCDECSMSCVSCCDTICGDCTAMCGCCMDNYCEQCIDKGKICNDCDKIICEGCNSTCEGCNRIICSDCCEKECEHCGVKMCKSCGEEHNCLLEVLSG